MNIRRFAGIQMIAVGALWCAWGVFGIARIVIHAAGHPVAVPNSVLGERAAGIVVVTGFTSPGIVLLACGLALARRAARTNANPDEVRRQAAPERTIALGVLGAIIGASAGWMGTAILLPMAIPGADYVTAANTAGLILAVVGLFSGMALAR